MRLLSKMNSGMSGWHCLVGHRCSKPRNFFSAFIAVLLTCVFSSNSYADIAVVVQKSHPINSLERKQVRAIFLGKLLVFPGKDGAIIALGHVDGSKVKDDFYLHVARKSRHRMASYWARSLFNGKAHLPKQVGEDKAVIEYIANDPNAIGYIDTKFLTDELKVLYQFKPD